MSAPAPNMLLSAILPRRISFIALFYHLLLHCLALLAFWFHTWAGLILLVVFYLLFGMLGLTIGYHRFLSHNSFRTGTFLRRFLALLGALAGQGGPLFWVANHRLHHSSSDTDVDPHNSRRGLLWSHLTWTLEKEIYNPYRRQVKDLAADPVIHWIERNYFFVQLLFALIIFGLSMLGASLYSVIAALVWAIPLRIVITMHCTFLTNSAAHRWGTQRYSTSDDSRNNWWVALLTFGEGWHNNHHAFPSSARHGLAWYEFDPSWWVISLMKSLGLVTRVVLPSRSELGQT